MDWEALTESQKNKAIELSNGCGVLIFVAPKSWVLYDACVRHDFYYWVGESSRDRLIADLIFLREMLEIIELNNPDYWTMRTTMWRATLYFLLVRLFGWMFFKKKKTWQYIEVMNHA